MERFSRYRRYRKATAAAAAAAEGSLPAIGKAAGNGTASETSTDDIPSAGTTPTPTRNAPFSAPSSIPRPVTAIGTIASTGPPTTLPNVPQAGSAAAHPSGRRSNTGSPSVENAQARQQGQSPAQPATVAQVPQIAQNKKQGATRQSRSPFRNLLRSSTKRPRGPPPSAAPTTALSTAPASPTAAIKVQMQNFSLPAILSSPSPTKRPASTSTLASTATTTKDTTNKGRQSVASFKKKPALPNFLNISPREMEMKFHDLMWLERSRLQNASAQPNGRWAPVPALHARIFDRYANIQPWDKNRIKLKVPEGHVEYINASPIVLTTARPDHAARPPDRFIAMQGPRQNSVDRVWRMVYEQLRSPAVIVMLTETHEGPQEKCYPYFPRSPDEPPMQINEMDEFGDGFRATVRCESIEETPYGDAIELRRIVMRVHRKAGYAPSEAGTVEGGAPLDRRPSEVEDDDTDMGGAPLQLMSSITTASTAGGAKIDSSDEEDVGVDLYDTDDTNDAKDTKQTVEALLPVTADDIDMADYEDERVVYHFLYKRWPDFGVPLMEDVDSFLGLMRLSAEKNADPDNPRIVHCSAGVGRSGTFIALEHLQRELEAGVFEDEAFTAPAQGQGQGEDGGGAAAAGMLDTQPDLVFSTVNQLREQRRMMVQAESQYMFIYRVLRRLWENKYGVTLPAAAGQESLRDEYVDSSSFSSEPAAKRLEVDPYPDRT